MADLTDPEYLIEHLEDFSTNATISTRYYSEKALTWELPQSHTIMFDIIPEKLSNT